MRIAIDIDSTLHHYWDQLSAVALDRYGVEMPYEGQTTWAIGRLGPEQLRDCVRETHTEQLIAAARPYPDAVDVVNGWARRGHFIHVTSHRAQEAHEATAGWLAAIGLRFDELYCSFDKIARCREIAIDLLIDDSPINLAQAAAAGISGATLRHPWTADLEGGPAVIVADDWRGLGAAIEPLLARDEGLRAG